MGISYNVMGELKGTELKEEVVAVGGHIDSWDAGIGSGAHDDAAPSIVAWEAVKLLQKLNLHPKRTIRAVLWVDEEYRQTGGNAYAEAHGKEKHFGLLEFDSGCFAPKGLGYTGPDSILTRIQEYEPLLKMVNDTFTITKGGGGVDIRAMGELGYPTMGWKTQNDDYFRYHHSPLDTPEAVNPKDMNDNIAAMAIFLYIYANM
jgi:carboxypeptidase Q